MEKQAEVVCAEGGGVNVNYKHVISTKQCDALFFNYNSINRLLQSMSVTNLENTTDAFCFVFTMF